MTKTDNNSDAPVDALTLPVENIRWKGDDPRPKPPKPWKTWLGIGTTSVFVLGVGVMGASAGPETARLAPPGCIFHTVVKGDTVWRVAGEAGITLDVVARLNPQIPRLNVIYPGDQIATACGVNELQRSEVVLIPAVTLVNVDRWLGERDQPGIASKKAVLAALYKAGARGNQLVTLGAITEGESGRKIAAVGDVDIQTGDWGPSVSVFQIRTLKSQTGKGTTRDIKRASTLEGGALSAVELWNQSQERGHDPGKPWTAYLKGWHGPHLASYTAAATEMGLL